MKDLFEYKNGELYWKVSRGRQKAGSLAGATITDGYKQVSINKKRYLVHRIIFQMFYGYMPEFPLEIDHINRIRHDNRIENLRVLTHKENMQHRKAQEK